MLLGTVTAGLLGLQAVRLAAVRGAGGSRFADAMWPSHPLRVIDRELTAIGAAAAQGRAPDTASVAEVEQVARRDPLASEPYLVGGTAALASGNRSRGERLLAIAVHHDPRSTGARLLLATAALQKGDLNQAMPHIAALARIVPGGAASLAPALAAFARQPAAAVRLAPLLHGDPPLRELVLAALAGDPANAGLVLQLAGDLPPPRAGTPLPEYQRALLASLVRDGQYDAARRLWTRFTGIRAAVASLNDPAFAASPSAPPFGWTLVSGPDGSAEADGRGGLQILYYGRNDVVLASQTTILPPGTYRLAVQVGGESDQAGDSVAWTVTCTTAKAPLGRLPLRGSGDRISAMTFNVSADCLAQNITLVGASPEFPNTVALSLHGLSLARVSG